MIEKITFFILDSEAKSDKVTGGLESTTLDDEIDGIKHNEKYVKFTTTYFSSFFFPFPYAFW